MNRARRPLAALAVTAVATLISACGSSAPADGGGTSNHEQALKFAACMRSNGVSNFPDPGASGTFTLDGLVNGTSLNPSTPAWKRAIGACQDLEPSGFTGTKRNSQQQQAALKFAECMRQNGVPDFPDPTANGPLIDTSRIPSADGRGARSIPGFTAAAKKCEAMYSGELGVRSQ